MAQHAAAEGDRWRRRGVTHPGMWEEVRGGGGRIQCHEPVFDGKKDLTFAGHGQRDFLEICHRLPHRSAAPVGRKTDAVDLLRQFSEHVLEGPMGDDADAFVDVAVGGDGIRACHVIVDGIAEGDDVDVQFPARGV